MQVSVCVGSTNSASRAGDSLVALELALRSTDFWSFYAMLTFLGCLGIFFAFDRVSVVPKKTPLPAKRDLSESTLLWTTFRRDSPNSVTSNNTKGSIGSVSTDPNSMRWHMISFAALLSGYTTIQLFLPDALPRTLLHSNISRSTQKSWFLWGEWNILLQYYGKTINISRVKAKKQDSRPTCDTQCRSKIDVDLSNKAPNRQTFSHCNLGKYQQRS